MEHLEERSYQALLAKKHGVMKKPMKLESGIKTESADESMGDSFFDGGESLPHAEPVARSQQSRAAKRPAAADAGGLVLIALGGPPLSRRLLRRRLASARRARTRRQPGSGARLLARPFLGASHVGQASESKVRVIRRAGSGQLEGRDVWNRVFSGPR